MMYGRYPQGVFAIVKGRIASLPKDYGKVVKYKVVVNRGKDEKPLMCDCTIFKENQLSLAKWVMENILKNGEYHLCFGKEKSKEQICDQYEHREYQVSMVDVFNSGHVPEYEGVGNL